MSNALPLLSNSPAPSARISSFPTPAPRSYTRMAPLPAPPPALPVVPQTTAERMVVARERIRAAAEAGRRIRSYEIALSVDMSEFHFARQFRGAFGRSPHVYYDEVRAELARSLLRGGMTDSDVARRIGFRRPAELRALLSKRAEAT